MCIFWQFTRQGGGSVDSNHKSRHYNDHVIIVRSFRQANKKVRQKDADMITLQDIQEARLQIAGSIRRTPLVAASPVMQYHNEAEALYLKLENMQVTGSFKARGAVNTVLSLAPENVARGLVTASGGNHGLGVAYAGWLAAVPVTIYLSHNTPLSKARKLESWGARVVYEGDVWDDAN